MEGEYAICKNCKFRQSLPAESCTRCAKRLVIDPPAPPVEYVFSSPPAPSGPPLFSPQVDQERSNEPVEQSPRGSGWPAILLVASLCVNAGLAGLLVMDVARITAARTDVLDSNVPFVITHLRLDAQRSYIPGQEVAVNVTVLHQREYRESIPVTLWWDGKAWLSEAVIVLDGHGPHSLLLAFRAPARGEHEISATMPGGTTAALPVKIRVS